MAAAPSSAGPALLTAGMNTTSAKTKNRAKRSIVVPFPSCLVRRFPAGHGPHHVDVLDLVGIDRVRIVGEHHEVRKLARGDRALDGLFPRRVGAVDREHAQRLI